MCVIFVVHLMAENSKIEWTDSSFNIVWGCWKISEGCKNCYADSWDSRFGDSHWGKDTPRKLMSEKYWYEPLKWDHKAGLAGRRHRIFCSSMTDVFLDDPIIDRERAKLWDLIQNTPNCDWLLLTKRPENIAANLPGSWNDGWSNVWMGVSCENQEWADKRIPVLADIPALIRFVSYEPALGPIDFRQHFENPCGPDWVIVGGESGPNARPFYLDWAISTVQQCRDHGVNVFVKQMGSNPMNLNGYGSYKMKFSDSKGGNIKEFPETIQVRDFPGD